jgi:hypothetical protein
MSETKQQRIEREWFLKRQGNRPYTKLIVPYSYGATGEIILETILEQYIKDISKECRRLPLTDTDGRMFLGNCLRVARKMKKDITM